MTRHFSLDCGREKLVTFQEKKEKKRKEKLCIFSLVA
jgi:hypothetical protein